MYHIVFDGNVFDRKGFLAMGGQSDELNAELQRGYDEAMELDAALQLAMRVLPQAAPAGETGNSVSRWPCWSATGPGARSGA